LIKYAKINGYQNLGETGLVTHYYQFIEVNKDIRRIILIHTYEQPTQVFKGYLYEKSRTYKIDKLNDNERATIEMYCGKVTEVSFNDLIKDGILEDYYSGYTEIETKSTHITQA